MQRTFSPRTREQDQREVNRHLEVFDSGMFPDIVPNKIQQGGVAKLDNARAYGDVLRGRTGSKLMSTLVLPYIDVTGYTFGTTTEAGVTDEGTMTVTGGNFFEDYMVGFKVQTSTEVAEEAEMIGFIRQVVSPTEAIIEGQLVTGINSWGNTMRLRGQINASYHDSSNGWQFYQIGIKLFLRVKMNLEWKEYSIIGDQLENSLSSFHNIDNEIILVNRSGIYKLTNDVDNPIALQMNQDLPEFNINRSALVNMTNPSAYNYIYSFANIEGDTRQSRRDTGSVITLETPPFLQVGKEVNSAPTGDEPYYPDGQYKDYTTNFSSTPIDDAWYTRITINNVFKDPLQYSELSDGLYGPNFGITVNGTSYTCYPNFSGVQTMTEVAERLQTALRQIDTGLTCKFGSISDTGDSETLVFYVYHVLFYYILSIGSATGSGFDMFLAGNACLATNNTHYAMGHSVQYLRYPENNNYITSYPLYRTKDILPHVEEYPDLTDPRLNNNPDTFALLDDVPVAKLFRAEINGTTGVMTVVSGFTVNDAYNDIITSNGLSISVTSPVRNLITGIVYQYNTGYTGVDIVEEDMYIGAEDYCVISKTSDHIQTSTGYVFSASDIGSVIFYSDGTTSYIIDYDTTLGQAVTADKNPKIAVSACLNPISRVYYDTFSDVVQNGFLSTDPLNMRFYTPLEETSISVYNSGVLFVGSDLTGTFNYSDTAKIYRIGYNQSVFQYSSSIVRNLVSMVAVGDYTCIFTGSDTYSINVKQGSIEVTDYGETFFVAPEPIKISSSIGMRNRDSWAYSDKDEIALITAEPAIRRFNGAVFGDNLANGSIQRTYLRKFANSTVINYDTSYGLTIWGTING